tara:strand:- start:13463 stop:13918 length:456 start_codon:yes stop_codon:yes gene_type:complete
MEFYSLKDIRNLSKKISQIIKVGNIIFLYGEIGVGKTTFVRFLVNHLEAKKGIKKSDILSPTFNIVYDYKIGALKIYHYDLYRIKNYKDILELGMFENAKKYVTIVEWPESIKKKPKNRIDIFFQYSKQKDFRKVKIFGLGKWKNYKFNEI